MRIDDDTYHRRGGKEYFRRYKRLRKYQYEMKLLNRGEYIKAVILTWGMTSEMVDGIRKVLYHKILRR